MKIITERLTRSELEQMARDRFGHFVKAVVDVERGLLAVDAELHSDLEALLLENGSKQKYLWGVNLYPQLQGEDFLEFDSMINMRPSQDNNSRSVKDGQIRKRIAEIVAQRIGHGPSA